MLVYKTALSRVKRRVLLPSAVGALFAAIGTPAQAHVKWFAPFNVAGQPRLVERVLDTDFYELSALALAIMLLGFLLDRTLVGEALSRALDRATAPLRRNETMLVRATCAFFFISIWNVGGVFLTPELKTSWGWISTMQLGMALALISRRTTWLAGLGIIVLYAAALRQYGLFHLLDYPIFLGVAVYLIVTSRGWRLPFALRPIDLLRIAAGITLMWASIEKWAYPEWTLPIYVAHPDLSMGYDFELFMQAAGVIEFTLAFALLGPPLVRRASALVLTGTFISATFEFGKLDVIGHSVIVAVLLVIAADDSRQAPATRAWRQVAMPTLAYTVALVLCLTVYYGMHALLFGTAIV